MKTIADILENAADLIDRNGFWQGGSRRKNTHCALTALGWGSSDGAEDRYFEIVATTFSRFIDKSIPEWNDTHTQAEVTSALRACATIERVRLANKVKEVEHA